MAKAQSVGQFEQIVLAAVLGLGENAYGVTIHARVEDLAVPKSISLGAVYVTLDRLEAKGLLESWLSEPTPERGGRAKRCYRLEPLGERVLRESAESVHRLHDAFLALWGERRWKPARLR